MPEQQLINEVAKLRHEVTRLNAHLNGTPQAEAAMVRSTVAVIEWQRADDVAAAPDQTVLVALHGGEMRLAYRYAGHWRTDNDVCMKEPVLYWAELPQPPEEVLA